MLVKSKHIANYKSVKRFIKHIKKHLAEYKMRLIWGQGYTVQCGGYTSSAYFSEDERVIRVARKNNLWLESLVHEYAHFLQWLDKSKIYKQSDSALTYIDKWFFREKIQKKRLEKAFYIVREMERDCEIRACRIAKKFRLPINLHGYARRANVYIYSHWFMEQEQKFWAFRRDPMTSRYILSLMPSNFRVHAHRKIPARIHKALAGYLK